jgi:hypothetical protein
MIKDDHYIVNLKNAHINTSEIEKDILKLAETYKSDKRKDLESIYNLIFSTIELEPKEPSKDQLICRYLTLDKFLQFIDSRSINFPIATQFSDSRDCLIPEDYDNAVLKVFHRLGISGDVWCDFVKEKAREWNVSCWTQLNDHFDDHLMWDSYAGGSQGVGITVRYGTLKESLNASVSTLHCGRVNYETLSLLPFNKHYTYHNEKEVRFAFRSSSKKLESISVDNIFSSLGVRISPSATTEHHDMIESLWIRYGGEDRIQWPR